MRDVKVWELSDILSLINNRVQEHLELDYKASLALTKQGASKDIAKDVSAFANSAGGMIIYGVVEQDHLPVSIDDGLNPVTTSKEWLEQIISSNIQPRIQDIIIRPIPIPSGNTLYVVNIPQATSLAPHQATIDNKYYKRFNFQSVPMQDFEVKDTLKRSSTGHPFIEFVPTVSNNADGEGIRYSITANIGNKSSEPVLYALVKFVIDDRLVSWTLNLDLGEFAGKVMYSVNSANLSASVYMRKIFVPTFMPVFKEALFKLGVFEFSLPYDKMGTFIFGYSILSPGFSFTGVTSIIIDGERVEEVGDVPLGLFEPA